MIARAENGETFTHAQIKEMIAGAKREGDAALADADRRLAEARTHYEQLIERAIR